MKTVIKRMLGIALALALAVSMLTVFAVNTSAASQGITGADGWFESAYAEWTPVSGANGYNAYIMPAQISSASWTKIDNELIRSIDGNYRVDAVGLKAGAYQIKIVPTSNGVELADKALITDMLTVMPYDRSGYAHFNYTEGVGAYNDDGTLKDNAIVLYVTNENKNTVSVTSKDGTTVIGIGNILGSTGMDVGGGKNSKGGAANTNSDILRKLAADGTPLVIRIIGNVRGANSTNLSSAVSEIDGLTQYDGVDYGGSVGDNGFMARMSGGKDITIEGIGYDACIDGWGLHFICQTADYAKGYGRSFEVRNIAFKNVPEDCVGMEGQQEDSTLTAPVERCWIHNCSFYAPIITSPAESDKDGGDGACDFKRGQYFTNSYCDYEGYHKTNLVGSSDSSLQYHLTYHHNYWKNCESRGPLARQANIHMYNNIFEGQTSYCMNPRANAYIFSEYNMFLNSKNPVEVKSGAVKSYHDSFASCVGNNGATIVSDRSTQVSTSNKYANFDTNASLSYIPSGDYVIQESIAEMKAVVLAYSGPQTKTVVSPDDVDISVIPSDRKPTSAVVLPYDKALNNSYVTSTSGKFDNVVFNVKKTASDCITVGGNPTGADIVFYVDCTFNVSMTEVSGTYSPTLCNAAGEAIIVGSGSCENLPAGYYFIQASAYDVGSSKYKEAKISALKIEKAIVCEDHSFTSKVTQPTCTNNGYTIYTCTTCGYSYTDNEVTAKGHTPGAASTCIAAQTCTTCGIEIAPLADHSYSNGSCTVCGKIDSSVCTHNNTISTITNPTCDKGGYTTYTCTACGYSYTGDNTAAKGHTPGADATCTSAQICVVCHEIIVEAKGHIYVNGICSCGAEDLAAKGYIHNFTENGKTSSFYTINGSLSDSKGDVSYDGLTLTQCLKVSSSAYITFTAPSDGKATFVFNPSCSGYTIYINGENSTEIPSNGIVEFEVSANTTYKVTKNKSESFLYYIVYTPAASEEVHEHSYTPSIDRINSCTEDGQITYSCSCGDSYTETIEATGHAWESDESGKKTCTKCGFVDNSGVEDEKDPDNNENVGGEENKGDVNDGNDVENGGNPGNDEPKKENFFVRFFNAIANFFRSIFSAIGKIFGM